MRKNKFFTIIVVAVLLAFSTSYAVVPVEGFSKIVSKLTPAVVNISGEYKLKMDSQSLCSNPAMLEEFSDFCERVEPYFGNKNQGNKKRWTSRGSGFLISDDGLIVTNYHVVSNAEKIKVVLSQCTENCQQYDAKIIGYDVKTDLAVLKIPGVKGLAHLRFGDSSKVRAGDWVLTAGNPFGLGGSVSVGIVSAISREIGLFRSSDFIQTDSALNPGNSGGPLCNTNGEVIGVNTASMYSNGSNAGIGFAVPSNVAVPVIDVISKGEQVQRGWIGVVMQEITNEVRDSLGGDFSGVLVASIDKKGPAYKSGLRVGDVITAVGGEKISGSRRLVREVSSKKIGDSLTLSVVRDPLKAKESLSLKVSVERAPKKHVNEIVSELEIIGIVVSSLTDNIRASFGLGDDTKGVIVLAVDPNKDTFLRAGDIIVGIGGNKQISTVQEFKQYIEATRKKGQRSVLMLINRGMQTIFAAVNIDD
ncbi:trypsin family protein [Neorickettsia helminthoeca str. Oregon]|uniref:Trypsin family protein n=1 Tax=Neorickettsia helminthoeca str. Oregon TaxID=1286528 RepID=X5GVN4_9RICK|nr:trypsin-like peptidase domain-containing protein [Neorickettsia helminthoeca]AHX11117.1 trypsin family protein [Neorickettsia helminthoeca str. Oregon]